MLGGDRILALDIGSSSLKLAEFSGLKAGGLQLMNYSIASLELDPTRESDRASQIVLTLRGMLRESGLKGTRVVMSVPGQSVFSRFVRLPPVDGEKIYKIILYEAQQNVPFPMDEVVWDYQLIGSAGGDLNVMLAAIKAEIIEELSGCVEQAGMEPVTVDVASAALYNAVRYNYDNLEGCVLVIDMGARSTDLIFMEQERIFMRSIPVAGNAVTQQIMREFDISFADAEELKKAHAYVAFGSAYEAPPSEVADRVSKAVRSVMTRIHAEINRSINFYRSQQAGSKPERLLLTGGTSVIPYTDTFLKEKLKTPVDYLNPFLNVAVSERIPAEQIARDVHLLAEVVGLGLRKLLSCPIELSLLPERVRRYQAARRKLPYLVLSGLALIMTMVVWAGDLFKMSALGNEYLGKLRERVTRMRGVESRLAVQEKKLAAAQMRLEGLLDTLVAKRRWAQMLTEVRRAVPRGIWVAQIVPIVEETSARADAGPVGGIIRRIEISGMGYLDRVPDSSPVRAFRDGLRKSRFFTADTELTWQPAPVTGDIVRRFKIDAVLEEPIQL
ncbi:MAG TPA: type IV pilus assembly protein PilM [Kiritimatiellae bacterium]|nr:type IV pilus assembly protein PilM [Kiritimatiellia bacterium]